MERITRRWWTTAVTAAAALVISGALVTAIFQLVMLMAPGYREDLADYVSRVAGQPVEIGGVSLGWSGLAPRLDLTDITLYGDDGRDPALSARRLRLGFGLARLVHGDTTPKRVELSGVELFAQIDGEGKISLRGLDTAGMPARARQDWLRQLGRFRSVYLSDCDLLLDDARLRGAGRGMDQPRFKLVEAELAFANGHGEASAELRLPQAIGSTVQLEAEIDGNLGQPQTWGGRWSAKIEGLTGLPWIDAALGEGAAVGFRDTTLKLEGGLIRGGLGLVNIRLDAGAVVGHKAAHIAELHDISLAASLAPEADGWVLDLDRVALAGKTGAWPTTRGRVRLARPANAPAHLEAEAAYLRLADLAPWLDLLPREPFGADVVRLRGVSGVVRGLVLRWDGAGGEPAGTGPVRYSLRADLEDLGLDSSAELPGFAGLSGEFSASENSGRLSLREARFGLHYPKVFAQAVQFEDISGDLNWTRTGEGWDLKMPRFGWRLDGSRGEGAFHLFVPRVAEQSPRLTLDARFSADDVTRLKAYQPVFWSQNLRDWLGTAIGAGRAPSARLKIDGELRDFPFVERPGTFALDIDAADARLAFAPDWPAIEKVAAHLEFRGNSLSIRGESGTISGNRVEQIQATIPDLHTALLNIQGEVQGDAARFYDFLRASPLAPRLSGLLAQTRASGDVVVKVALDIPLHSVKDLAVAGEVQLRGARLDLVALPEPVVGVQGFLGFDNHSVSAQGLSGSMYGTPVEARIATDTGGVLRLHAGFDFEPDAQGGGASALLPGFLRRGMEGRSAWQAMLPLSGAQAGRLRLSSSLQGTRLSLPQPMDKPAEAAWPVNLEFDADKFFPLRVAVDMPERLGADLAFVRDAGKALQLQRARLRAGAGPAPHASEDGVFISGTVADLDPLRWVNAMSAPGGGSVAASAPGLPISADLNVGRLWLGGQLVEGVRLTHSPAAGGWLARLSGNGALGELAYRAGEDGGLLRGRFEHAHFARHRKHENAANAAGRAPFDEQAEDLAEPADPGRLPRLDLAVENLKVGDAELGRLEMRTARVADGQRIDVLRSSGRGGQIEASGQWRRSAGRSSADLQFTVESSAVEELLQGLGYAPSLSARRSRFKGQLAWPEQAPGATRGLRWALGEGQLDLDIDKGMLRSVEPGAGRVLGLINFWALPRRLTLDFRDVLSEGLGFDQIKGGFAIGQGIATTDNLNIDAPSLKMEIRGRVGLVARDYDQRVTVNPDVSAGVTLGALVLGGPVAAVLALIAQEVLDQPLDQVGQLSYHLTGSWDDPQVQREGGLLPGSRPRSKSPAAPAAPGVAPAAAPAVVPPTS